MTNPPVESMVEVILISRLIDLHVHLSDPLYRTEHELTTDKSSTAVPSEAVGVRDLHGFIYCGVMTIYDPRNFPDFIFRLGVKERAGKIIASRGLYQWIFHISARPRSEPGRYRDTELAGARPVLDRLLADSTVSLPFNRRTLQAAILAYKWCKPPTRFSSTTLPFSIG